MKDKLGKTPGLNNPESYVLTHNRFNTYMVLLFSDLNKAQIHKMPFRNSPHQEIEILMSFDYLNVFKTNNEIFLFEIGDKNYIYVGGKVITFETNDIIVKYNSEYGFNDVKYPYAYGEENNYFILHQKNIPIQEYKMSTEKSDCLYKMDDELNGDKITVENEGVVDYGNDFINCKIIHSKQ